MTKPEARPRVLVMGLGGIGGVVCSHLIEQGVDLVPVTTNTRIAGAIAERGYRIREDGETRVVAGTAATAPADDGRKFDFVLLATQPPQVEEAARTAAPFLADDGAMVCFQNGLVEERVAEIVGGDRVIGAIIAWGASMLGPGEYERTSGGGFTIGRFGRPNDDGVTQLGLLLESVGPVERTDNLRGARWSKLAINCAISTIGTIGGLHLGALMKHRYVRRLALEIMSETVAVARAEDVRLEKVSGTLDLDWLALTEAERSAAGSPALFTKHAMLLAVGARYRRLRSSMLSAIERGRKPAVDFLNGEVVSRGKRHGIGTPVNARAQALVHAIADGEAVSELSTVRALFDATRR